MVSKASEDLPEPLKPVMTTSLSRGILSVRFLRLCSRAPPILMKPLLTDSQFRHQTIGKPNTKAFGAKGVAVRSEILLSDRKTVENHPRKKGNFKPPENLRFHFAGEVPLSPPDSSHSTICGS